MTKRISRPQGHKAPSWPRYLPKQEPPITGCRWPIGDPKQPGFRLCGASCNGVYCDEHERLARGPKGKPVS